MRGHRGDERNSQPGAHKGLNRLQLCAAKTDVVMQIVPVAKTQYLIAKTVAFLHDDEAFAREVAGIQGSFACERMSRRQV